ncbi:MAG: retroviral-like aspartic protease family protein [Bacteroides sp.]|nr:retroviral-like aspartic protease family protein [Bacteroides sp.]
MWKLYNDSAAYFKDEMRLYSQICIGYAFNRPELTIKSIDSLYTYYPSDEYPPNFKYIRAKSLLELGRYNELAAYCKSCEKDSVCKIDPDYAWIEALAYQLAGTPDCTIDFPQGECTIPASRDFPLRITIQLNGMELPNTILDTGAPFTLLSHETAKKYNIRMFKDTVIVGTYCGPIEAVTGIIEELCIGDIVCHHAYVKVASPQVPDYFLENNTLGIQELAKLSSVEIAPGQITFRKNIHKDTLHPNVCFRNGHPYIQSINNNQIEEYILDTGYDTNHLYTNDSIPEDTPVWCDVSGNPVQFFTKKGTNSIAGKCNGTLGLPYIYNFESCLLDFDKMAFTGTGCRKIPFSYSMCINNGDFAHLNANREWYKARTNEMGRWIINSFTGFTKNDMDMCIQYADSLLNKYTNELGFGIISIQNVRAIASAYTGDFPAAILFLKNCIEQNSNLLGSLNKCQAMLPIDRQRISWHTPSVILPASMDDNGLSVTAKINQKELRLYFIPEKTECMISSEEAEKYQMQIIEYEEDSAHKEK